MLNPRGAQERPHSFALPCLALPCLASPCTLHNANGGAHTEAAATEGRLAHHVNSVTPARPEAASPAGWLGGCVYCLGTMGNFIQAAEEHKTCKWKGGKGGNTAHKVVAVLHDAALSPRVQHPDRTALNNANDPSICPWNG
ncbi:hypothetical protein ACCO45_001434 [Purpureocillium lilacinum]|uniref:Uncharacterized protein n=1 Tax=Purpureocillium lilacinum TaxID=33203 RepID=A0ACC4E9T8_PURLI